MLNLLGGGAAVWELNFVSGPKGKRNAGQVSRWGFRYEILIGRIEAVQGKCQGHTYPDIQTSGTRLEDVLYDTYDTRFRYLMSCNKPLGCT